MSLSFTDLKLIRLSLSTNIQYKLIILDNYRLLPIYTSIINLFYEIVIFVVYRNNLCKVTQKNNVRLSRTVKNVNKKKLV